MDLPRTFTIRESSHRILDPFTSAKLATLGHALALEPGMRILDLACGKGELICTWAGFARSADARPYLRRVDRAVSCLSAPSGSSVMTASTPMAAQSSMSAAALATHTWTSWPAAWTASTYSG